jgi:hypothetical protein
MLNRHLLLSFVCGESILHAPEFRVFLASARRRLPSTVDKVLYTTSDTPNDDIRMIESFGFATCRTDQIRGNYLRDRWRVYAQDLHLSRDSYQHVCIADSRDVLFQDDPFAILDAWLIKRGCDALVFSEGMSHRECPWNANDQLAFQSACAPWQCDFNDWPVANAGVLLGKLSALRQLCCVLYVAMLPIADRCTDQAALNYMVNTLFRYSSQYHVEKPSDCPLVVTGQGIKNGHVTVAFDGQIRHPDDRRPYCIVHQWDRTEYHKSVVAQFDS